MGLYVGMFCTEQLHGTIACDVFQHIHIFATAVISFPRITFGILIGQHRSGRFHHGCAGIVLGSDQFKSIDLTATFLLNGFPNTRI